MVENCTWMSLSANAALSYEDSPQGRGDGKERSNTRNRDKEQRKEEERKKVTTTALQEARQN